MLSFVARHTCDIHMAKDRLPNCFKMNQCVCVCVCVLLSLTCIYYMSAVVINLFVVFQVNCYPQLILTKWTTLMELCRHVVALLVLQVCNFVCVCEAFHDKLNILNRIIVINFFLTGRLYARCQSVGGDFW